VSQVAERSALMVWSPRSLMLPTKTRQRLDFFPRRPAGARFLAVRFLVVCILGLVLAGEAGASILVARDARSPSLRVNGMGYAEVAWRDTGGTRRTLVIPPTGRLRPGAHLEGRNVARE